MTNKPELDDIIRADEEAAGPDETVHLTEKGRHYLKGIKSGLSHSDALIYAEWKTGGVL